MEEEEKKCGPIMGMKHGCLVKLKIQLAIMNHKNHHFKFLYGIETHTPTQENTQEI